MAYTTLISAEELHRNLDRKDWVVVDCRFGLGNTEKGREDYLASHIPGARYAHLDEDLSGPIIPGETGRHPLPDIPSFVHQLSRWGIANNTQVVAYDSMGGPFAARLWWMLKWLGHENVAVLDGGFPAWLSKGYATTDTLPQPTPALYSPSVHPNRSVPVEEVVQNLEQTGMLLIDARAEQRYAGEHEPIDPVAGHIPGALSYPFKGNLTEDGYFKSAGQLKERFHALSQHSPNTKIVCYCGSGVTAAHNILAIVHAGLPFPAMYAGSWSEWITDQNRPISKNSGK